MSSDLALAKIYLHLPVRIEKTPMSIYKQVNFFYKQVIFFYKQVKIYKQVNFLIDFDMLSVFNAFRMTLPNQELSVLYGGPTLNYGKQLSLYVPYMVRVSMTGDLTHLQLSDLQSETKAICRTSDLQRERMLICRT